MRKILCSVIFVAMLLIVCNISYGQATAGQHNPYQNLAIWFATQSMPTAEEKAIWALNDINAYRELKGLQPFDESVLTTKVQKPRLRLFKIFRKR